MTDGNTDLIDQYIIENVQTINVSKFIIFMRKGIISVFETMSKDSILNNILVQQPLILLNFNFDNCQIFRRVTGII